MLLSIAAAVATALLKFVSYWITGSVSLLSDAAESIVNLLAATTAFLSILYAARPVDPTHTYGHEKIEYFSSGVEGALILVAALSIAYYAMRRLLVPEPLEQLDLGAAISLLAALINLAVALVLLRVGKAHGSIVLEADGLHLMTDVYTSAGVLVGLAVIWTARRLWDVQLDWLDPVIALVLAANITWTGLKLVLRSFNGLMDHALPEQEQAALRSAIEKLLEPRMDFHAVRTRQAGTRRFVDFHLLVPGDWSVSRAHSVGLRIEDAIKQTLPGVEVSVHIEPIEERVSWEDSELVAIEQAARRAEAERRGQGEK